MENSRDARITPIGIRAIRVIRGKAGMAGDVLSAQARGGNIMVLPIKKAIGLLFVMMFMTTVYSAAEGKQDKTIPVRISNWDTSPGGIPDEPSYRGRTLAFWIKAIRDRNEEMMPLAFEAIRSLGPDAWAAVPELTRLVSAPFAPIRLGKDSDKVIASKLYDIEVRSEAIDTLACIGAAASPATIPVIEWALTLRVAPTLTSNRQEDERFVDLVTLDAEYRIGIINAVVHFGEPATPILIRLLNSNNAEQRKLAVIILGVDALPVVEHLLKSRDCGDAELGITILGDMEPVVAKAYLAELEKLIVCSAN